MNRWLFIVKFHIVLHLLQCFWGYLTWTSNLLHQSKTYWSSFSSALFTLSVHSQTIIHLASSDPQHRSHFLQVGSTFKGTLRVLCCYCDRSYHAYSSCRVPWKVLRQGNRSPASLEPPQMKWHLLHESIGELPVWAPVNPNWAPPPPTLILKSLAIPLETYLASQEESYVSMEAMVKRLAGKQINCIILIIDSWGN